MYTEDEVTYLKDRLIREGAGKPEIVRRLAQACIGWPYVFGAAGEMCTPEVRRKYAGYNPEYAENIRKACPVLSGKQASCDGCQWQRCRCFDCRGFTRWLLSQAGLDLAGAGATSQWDTAANWAASGTIDSISQGLVCCVFKRKDGKMSHTGISLGNWVSDILYTMDTGPQFLEKGPEIIHCSTTVKTDTLPGRPAWTHWGVPAGLYSTEELRAAGLDADPARNIPTLRKGAKGELVKTLQTMLNDETDAGLDVDGKFGAKTEAAVIHFQGLHDLKEDGIVGPKTWKALGVTAPCHPEQSEETPSAEEHFADVGNTSETSPGDTDAVDRTTLKVLYAQAMTIAGTLKKIIEGE